MYNKVHESSPQALLSSHAVTAAAASALCCMLSRHKPCGVICPHTVCYNKNFPRLLLLHSICEVTWQKARLFHLVLYNVPESEATIPVQESDEALAYIRQCMHEDSSVLLHSSCEVTWRSTGS